MTDKQEEPNLAEIIFPLSYRCRATILNITSQKWHRQYLTLSVRNKGSRFVPQVTRFAAWVFSKPRKSRTKSSQHSKQTTIKFKRPACVIYGFLWSFFYTMRWDYTTARDRIGWTIQIGSIIVRWVKAKDYGTANCEKTVKQTQAFRSLHGLCLVLISSFRLLLSPWETEAELWDTYSSPERLLDFDQPQTWRIHRAMCTSCFITLMIQGCASISFGVGRVTESIISLKTADSLAHANHLEKWLTFGI